MSAVQKCFIARHGERQDLVDKSWLDTAENPGDPPLTEAGLQQAHQLGLRLQGEGIGHIYASPFLRTVQTAHEVAKVLDVPVKLEYGLSEGLLSRLFPHGEPCMLPRAHLNREMPLVSLEECSFWGKVAFPEKYSGVSRRVRETIQAILEKHPEESVVLVGHGLSVDYMVRTLLPKGVVGPMPNIPYCALSACSRRVGGGDWKVDGKLWDDSFLRNRQNSEDAAAQTKSWGLE